MTGETVFSQVMSVSFTGTSEFLLVDQGSHVLNVGSPVMEQDGHNDSVTGYKPFGEYLDNGGFLVETEGFVNDTDFVNVTSPTGSNAEMFFVPPGIVALLSILYGSISAITVVGNVLVILVIAKNKAMRTVTNFFIANLSVADVIIGIFGIPFQFQAALLQRWDLPHILCPVAPFVKELTVNVSILTLAVISIDRYVAVIHPLRPRCSRRVATGVMMVVWTFSIVSAILPLILYRVHYNPETDIWVCSPVSNSTAPSTFQLLWIHQLYLVIVQYFLPLGIISFAYARIMLRIWFSRTPGSAVDSRDQMVMRNKRKVIKMLVIVVALFALCWLPLQTYNLLSIVWDEVNNYEYINLIWLSSNWLAMSNSCYNPFIYGLCNEKFKHGFRILFVKCPCVCCRRPSSRYNDRYDFSEDGTTYRTNISQEDTRLQTNGKRCKRYMRVMHGIDNTELSNL